MVDVEVKVKISKLLPLTNCGDCGEKNCFDLAGKVMTGEKKVTDCPHVTPENLQEISLILEDYLS